MRIVNTAATILLCILFASCEGDEIFQEELYERIVYVLTKEEDKVFSEVHSLDNEISEGYVSVLVSGSTSIVEPVTVEFESDHEALDKYNVKMFGVDESLYLRPLDESFYDIPKMSIVITPGEMLPRGLFPIRIKPEGLSPDSIYFIPLKLKSASPYTISETNSSVLYRVYIKNKYANQKDRTLYSMSGERMVGDNLPYSISGNKILLPLSKNKVRTTVDQRSSYETSLQAINTSCMVVEVVKDSSLVITPYNSDYMELEMVQKENCNKYRKDILGKYRFYLSYRYRSRSSVNDGWGEWTTINESLMRYEEEKQ